MLNCKLATALQEAMLLESQNDSSTNISQWVWRLPINLDLAALETSCNQLISRHDVLRSHFMPSGKSLAQQFNQKVTINVDTSKAASNQDLNQQLEKFLISDRHKSFNISVPPLFRCRLFTLADASCCVFTFHQSIMDSDSFALFLNEIICSLKQQPLTEEKAPNYQDFLTWYEKKGSSVDHKYWCGLLQNSPEPLLPKLPMGVSNQAFLTKHKQIKAKLSNVQQLTEFAATQQVNLETIFQAAWIILLHRYCNTDDITFGASGQFRNIQDINTKKMLGSFLNTLPIRIQLTANTTVKSLLNELERQHQIRLLNPHTPLLEILKHGNKDGSLFHTSINFEHVEWESMLEQHGTPWSETQLSDAYESSFNLACNIRLGQELKIKLDYDVDKYNSETANQILKHFQNILSALLKSSSQHVFNVNLLDQIDTEIIKQNSGCKKNGGAFVSVQEKIYRQAQKTPEAIAVSSDTSRLTYNELTQQADNLALRLITKGVCAESIIVIALPRSTDFIVAALAVLRAGAAYLPVNPEEPNARLTSMLTDTKALAILTYKKFTAQLNSHHTELILVDEDTITPKGHTFPICQANQAAYVIFTSGTTGTPKGVLIEHHSLSNHCNAINQAFHITHESVALQFANTVFDVHIEEIFTTLCAGGNLVLRNDDMAKTAREFFAQVIKWKISILNIPTAFWATLVEATNLGQLSWPDCIKTLVVGGERVNTSTFLTYQKQNTQAIQFFNGYGPTETTITSTYYKVPKEFSSLQERTEKLSHKALPIGQPITGATHYIVNNHQRLNPLGVTGELYIGGEGVARGYLNNPELTREKFTALSEISHSDRFYATGDQVFSDGKDLFFVGRVDHQVKVRGYRIELGDIESTLLMGPGVQATLVDVDPMHPDILVAFVKSRKKSNKYIQLLNNHLAEKLPAHMCPSHIKCLSDFPLTAAGKIDRKRLWAAFEQAGTEHQEETNDKPLSERQKKLIGQWKTLLGDIQISLTDSFFDLGGHSLLAVKLFSKIEKEFNISIPLRIFFANPTIDQLDQLIEQNILTPSNEPEKRTVSIGSLHPLQPKGRGCPVYCICGVELYQDLAIMLGEQQPIYGIFLPVEEKMLQSFSDKKKRFELPSVQEMAKDYVNVIRKNQPFGPYKLAGISFGGILAYEIAQQLVADGEIVETLVLIDSFVPRKQSRLSYKKIQSQFERIQMEGLGYLTWLVRKLLSMYTENMKQKKLLDTNHKLDNMDFNLYRALVYRKAALNYSEHLKPFQGKVLLIHALDGGGTNEGFTTNDHGWGKYANGGVKRINVQGDHVGVLKQPNVKVLADNIKNDIQTTSYITVQPEGIDK